MNVSILGAGGLGKAAVEAFESVGEHAVCGFFDDHVRGHCHGLPVLGKLTDFFRLRKKPADAVYIAIGDRFLPLRLELIAKVRQKGWPAPNAIHRTAYISPSVKLGKGIYIGPMTAIHTGTRVGDFCTLWSGVIIEHNNRLGENAFVAPAVATVGYTVIGRDVFVGIGARILKTRIGHLATVAAGSLVLSDVPPRSVVMGVPARVVSRKTRLEYHT